MSAVEALAEAMDEHAWNEMGCICGWQAFRGETVTHHRASAVVAAIRSMPAEQVAELIGGSVEFGGVTAGPSEAFQMTWAAEHGAPTAVPKFIAKHQRPVGPWLPLGVSPETNGEQK